MSLPAVSVIVPVGGRYRQLEVCLANISRALHETDEIIVVADGDIGPLREVAKQAEARIVDVESSRGPALARNRGARAASREILFFVDADVIIRPDTVDAVRETFREDGELAAMFGSYDDTPSAGNFISQYKNLCHHYVHQSAREDAFTFWTGCGAIRREVFTRLGGFDESYPRPSVEDIEFGYRLRAAGYRIRLQKSIQVTHEKRWTLSSLLHADLFCRAIPWTELILASGRFENDLNIDWSARIKVALAGLLLGALISSVWFWPVIIVAGASAMLLVAMDAGLLRFFCRKRGVLFAIRAIPMQWLYYLYSGIGFVAGALIHAGRRWRSSSVRPAWPERGKETA